MENSNCFVYNDTKIVQNVYVFNKSDEIREIPRDTIILQPEETRLVEALLHRDGLILATDMFENGYHIAVPNGETARISDLIQECGSSW